MIRVPAIRNKYGVSATADRTYAGRVFHSKREMIEAQELDIKKQAGLIKDWWAQVSFPITVSNQRICTVILDFRVLENNGHNVYIEVKGVRTAIWRLKKKLLLACYPDIDLREIT